MRLTTLAHAERKRHEEREAGARLGHRAIGAGDYGQFDGDVIVGCVPESQAAPQSVFCHPVGV